MKKILCIAFAVCTFVSFTATAQATINRNLTYRYNQIWNGLVRFLRVDNDFEVVEKNKTAGYIMFEYRDKDKSFPSSFELIPVIRDNRYYIRVGLRISEMPTYIEVVLFDQLIIKLKKDFGLPPDPSSVDANTAAPRVGDPKDKAPGTGIGAEPPEDEEDIEVDEDKLEETEEEK